MVAMHRRKYPHAPETSVRSSHQEGGSRVNHHVSSMMPHSDASILRFCEIISVEMMWEVFTYFYDSMLNTNECFGTVKSNVIFLFHRFVMIYFKGAQNVIKNHRDSSESCIYTRSLRSFSNRRIASIKYSFPW